jgi:antitoxin (DNA-binding transcriptional repressor) of toxin-antitoxin stability system
MKIGLRQANQGFARAMRAVRAGQDVVLTDRGRPLAVIRRIPEADDGAARLAALVGEGLVRPAGRAGSMPAPRWRPERVAGGSIAETVRRDRDETA